MADGAAALQRQVREVGRCEEELWIKVREALGSLLGFFFKQRRI